MIFYTKVQHHRTCQSIGMQFCLDRCVCINFLVMDGIFYPVYFWLKKKKNRDSKFSERGFNAIVFKKIWNFFVQSTLNSIFPHT